MGGYGPWKQFAVADVLAVEDLVTGPGGDARPRTGREQGGLVEPGHVEHQPRRHQEPAGDAGGERGLDLLLPRLVLPRQDPHRDHHEREEQRGSSGACEDHE